MVFRDRVDAGRRLAERLLDRPIAEPIVLGLPRGGVVVAAEIAHWLNAPLDLAVAKKIGHPENPEAAIGSVAEDGTVVLDPLHTSDLEPKWLEREIESKRRQAQAQRIRFTGSDRMPELAGKTVVLVDDGIATGQTMLAAIEFVRHRGAMKIVVAIPVGAPAVLKRLRERGIEVVAVIEPESLYAVGAYYADFRQISNEEVKRLMATGL